MKYGGWGLLLLFLGFELLGEMGSLWFSSYTTPDLVMDMTLIVLVTLTAYVLIRKMGRYSRRLEAVIDRYKKTKRELEEREEDLRQIFHEGQVMIWSYDSSLTVSHGIKQIIGGWNDKELTLKHLLKRVHPDDRKRLKRSMRQWRKGISAGAEVRFRHANGRVCWLEVQGISIRRNPGTVRYIGAITDITSRKEVELSLRESKGRFLTTLESISDGVITMDKNGNVTYMNPRAEEMTGWACEEAVGRPKGQVIQWSREGAKDLMLPLRYLLHRSGKRIPVDITETPLYGKSPGAGTVMVMKDISERAIFDREIRRMAFEDDLTGIWNRRYFEKQFMKALHHGGWNRLTVLFLNLDEFKRVNDSLGHEVGDQLLMEVARRLQSAIDEGDIAARFSGDEFIVLMHGATDEEVRKTAEKIQNELRKKFVINGYELYSTCSIGISSYPDDGEDMETIMKNADLSMYYAKEKGKNHFRLFSQTIQQQMKRIFAIHKDIHHAIERQDFVLYFQPKVEAVNGHISGLEALIRWRHPKFGIVSAAEFMPYVERSTMIYSIGEWVLENACRSLREWREKGIMIKRLAVNVSANQLLHHQFLPGLQNQLQRYDLKAQDLEIEITESVMKHKAKIIPVLKELRAMGHHVTLDDFGTGYSSLSDLKELPLTTLKIDKSFVRHLQKGEPDVEIVKTIIQLARHLHLHVIAEGIETPEQLAFFKRHGAAELQGYLFSKPLPAHALMDYFSEHPELAGKVKA